MSELDIGVLLLRTEEKVEGIFSEINILKRVIGFDLVPEKAKIQDVMSPDRWFLCWPTN